MIEATIYDSTNKCVCVIYILNQFFFYEFNSDVHFMIEVIIYDKTGKFVRVIYDLK
jgi:hypothetical protein